MSDGITHYLEIGVAVGGSIRVIHDAIGIARTSVIDRGDHPAFPLFRDNTKEIPNLELFHGDSHSDAAKQFLEGRTFDLVGINGDRSYAGVKSDWKLVRPHLAPGALVGFHVTNWCEGVREFFRDGTNDFDVGRSSC